MADKEASFYALTLDRIGHDVIAHLEKLPEPALHWNLPLLEQPSLFACATRLVQEGEFWIQAVIGSQRVQPQGTRGLSSGQTSEYLIARYTHWLQATHEILDDLPDETMNKFVVLPALYEDIIIKDGPITVRDCLLHVIEHSAMHYGYIQLLSQLLLDGERLFDEVSTQRSTEG